MDNRIKAAASTFSIFAGLIALSATVYAVKNRKGISTSVKEDVNGLTDRFLAIGVFHGSQEQTPRERVP